MRPRQALIDVTRTAQLVNNNVLIDADNKLRNNITSYL